MKKIDCSFRFVLAVLFLVFASGCRHPFKPIIMADRNGELYYYTRNYLEARESMSPPRSGGGQWGVDPYKLLMFMFFIGPPMLFEKYIVSPVADTVAMPYDLCLKAKNAYVCANDGVYIMVQDRSGRPIPGLEVDLIIDGEFGRRIIYDGNVCPKGAYFTHVFTNGKGEVYVPIDLESCGNVRFSGWELTSSGGEDFGGTIDRGIAKARMYDSGKLDSQWKNAAPWYVFTCPRCDSKGVSADGAMWSTNGVCVKCGKVLSKLSQERRIRILSRWERIGLFVLPSPTRAGYLALCGRTGLTFEALEQIYGACPTEEELKEDRRRVLVRLKGRIDLDKLSRDIPQGMEIVKGTAINEHLINRLGEPLNMTVGLAVRKEFNTVKLPEKITDFNSFWDAAKVEMRKGWNKEVKEEKIADMSSPSTCVSRVEFNIAGRCVSGLLFEPEGNAPRVSVPTIAFFGRGPDPDAHGLAIPTNKTVLYLSVFKPGYDYLRGEYDLREKYHLGQNAQLDAYAIDGIDMGCKSYFFYPVLSGALWAAEWLARRENAKGVRCIGSDQGASLAIMVAALSDDVVEVEAYHPDFVGVADDPNVWPSFHWHNRSKRMGEAQKWLPYYEVCSFANRIKCPSTLYLNMHEMSRCRKRTPCISVFKALEKSEGKRLVIDNSMKASEALRTLVLN